MAHPAEEEAVIGYLVQLSQEPVSTAPHGAIVRWPGCGETFRYSAKQGKWTVISREFDGGDSWLDEEDECSA